MAAENPNRGLQSTFREKPMELLVLGLSRTGTSCEPYRIFPQLYTVCSFKFSAIRQALKDLGHERVYHTFSVYFDEPDHGDIWVEAFKGKFEGGKPFRGNDWERLLGKYTARKSHLRCTIDLPPAN